MRMQLLTDELKQQLPALGSTDGQTEKVAVCKFFNPTGIGTWFVFEGEETPDGDWMFFGLADLGHPELGYFNLSGLEAVSLPFGMGIERDIFFSPQTLDI